MHLEQNSGSALSANSSIRIPLGSPSASTLYVDSVDAQESSMKLSADSKPAPRLRHRQDLRGPSRQIPHIHRLLERRGQIAPPNVQRRDAEVRSRAGCKTLLWPGREPDHFRRGDLNLFRTILHPRHELKIGQFIGELWMPRHGNDMIDLDNLPEVTAFRDQSGLASQLVRKRQTRHAALGQPAHD